jgi:hypothetical protein
LLRGFRALAKSVPEGAKFRNTPSACGGDRNFEDFASLFRLVGGCFALLATLPSGGAMPSNFMTSIQENPVQTSFYPHFPPYNRAIRNLIMSKQEEHRQEIEATREAFYKLLASIPDEAFSLPSDNPVWTMGEVLFHMTLAPRFLTADLRLIIGQAWISRVLGAVGAQIPFRLAQQNLYPTLGA